jgi:hypothetical protein
MINEMIYVPQEITQSARTTPNEVEVTSSNFPSPSCVDMLKKEKKRKRNGTWVFAILKA